MARQRDLGAYSFGLAVVVACLYLLSSALAQSSGQTQSPAPASPPPAAAESKEIGGFHVTQSIEVGGRISEVTGSEPMYDTLVNYQSGARILEQSLTMQSISHQDIFDTLTFNSFGWGGDPEQAARLRVAKYSWYTFSGSYQHMQNYFDYDLFANPLNPPSGGSPFIPILDSPHTYYDRQNLYNFDLVILPMHRLSFRVDYNRNRIIGPSFSSVHQGTDALTNQNWNNTLNGYRFGADFRVNKKTTLSYTQSLQYYFGGATYGLNNFNSWPLSNGQQVTFGLPWFNGGSPCTSPLQKNGTANPSCNGYFTYGLDQHVNTSIPTEQINLTSSSLKWLDFNAQYQYSHASSNTPLTETFTGLITRSANLGYTTAGSKSNSRWNSSSADGSAIIHINDKTRLVETFRFRNFSVAGDFLNLQTNYFASGNASSATLLTPIASFPPSLLHNSSSPADIMNETTINMIGQRTLQNDFQFQYDISRYFGVRLGFNWANYIIQPGNTYQAALGDIYYPKMPNRGNCVGVPLNPDGSCTFTGVITPWGSPTTEINRYTEVLGAWYRKGNLHANISAQAGGADNWIYRTDPTSFFNINANVSYAPRSWLTVGGNFIYQQGQNGTGGIDYNQHNYSTMVNATITPSNRWGLDLAYNFDAIQQNIVLCFQDTTPPPGSVPCFGDNTLLQTNGIYQTHTQYGYFALRLTPLERVTVRLGYTVVDNQGNTTSFNSLLPLGPLSSTYQTPLAAVDVNVYKNVTFKAGYNYYQYNEGSFVGPTAPRYFHANNTTLALRYAF